jgi:hypothetical protein
MTVHPDDVDEKEMQPGTHITIAMDGTDRLSSLSPWMEQSPTVGHTHNAPDRIASRISVALVSDDGEMDHDFLADRIASRISVGHTHNGPDRIANRIEQPIRERPFPFIADVPWGILPSAFPSASVVETPALVSDDGEIPELVSDDGETLGGF